jgi:hypothetical protein
MEINPASARNAHNQALTKFSSTAEHKKKEKKHIYKGSHEQ